MFLNLRSVLTIAALVPFMNGGCDPSNLAPGLTGESNPLLPASGAPSIAVTPDNQDITDQDYAFLFASTANVPEPSTDFDGIHAAARIRWTIVSGTGGLNRIDPNASNSLDNAKTLDTDPAAELGATVLYFPDLGTSGEIKVKAELIRPTDRTEINEFGEASQQHEDIILATAEAVIRVNDELRLRLTPPVTQLPFGGSVSLKAEFTEPGASAAGGSGREVGPLRYEWNLLGLAGAGDLQSSPDSDTAVFKAFTEAATFTVTVKAFETMPDGSERESGPARATVTVDPKLRYVTTFGYYAASDDSTDSNYYSVNAWVYIPKVQGAVSYSIVGQGMHDAAYYGTHWSWSFSGNPPRGSIPIEDRGGAYRFNMSSAGGAVGGGYPGLAYGYMNGRFSGMRVIVTATVAD